MATNPQYTRTDTPGGGALFVAGAYGEEEALAHIGQKLSTQTNTPAPASENASADGKGAGPVKRFNDIFSIGSATLESIGLTGYEISEAVRTRKDELYRNEFPVWKPRFVSKCEACESEFGHEVDGECPACGHEDLRRPDPAEKKRAQRLSESVNKEGQSLRELAKLCEPDQWFLGVSVIVIKHEYRIASQDSTLYDRGEVISKDVDELVRGDPKRIVPVVDERGRVGGLYTCPRHRDDPVTAEDFENGHTRCETCDAELQEVYYAERESQTGQDARAYYFDHEIVTWAYPFPRLNGLDGLAPVHHVWLKQAILDFMDTYAGSFYDPDADRKPNQMVIMHTTNPDQWEALFNEAEESDDPYESPFFTNEYSTESSSTPEAQVIDVMPDELLGQNQEIKSDFKSDIRQAMGISDAHDSDLEEAGGLNNEGLQIEITDRSIASQQQDYRTGWLDELAKRLGVTDWYPDFLPQRESDVDDMREQIDLGREADEAGLDARYEDGQTVIEDGEFDSQTGDGAGIPGMGFSSEAASDHDDAIGQKGDPMVNGHDLDPETGEGICSSTGETISAETMQDLAGDCPHCGQALSVIDTKADTDDLEASVQTLERAYKHIVWADETEQKAQPFFAGDKDVPEFVRDLVQRAIDSGAVYGQIEDFSMTDKSRLSVLLDEKLTQPQGWSVDSLSDAISKEFVDVDKQKAEDIAQNEAANVLNKSREIGYREQGDMDDRLFKWIGPDDDDNTDACEWLRQKTNPRYGGTPRPLDELKDLVQEANRRFVDGHDAREWMAHIGERHTYVEHYN